MINELTRVIRDFFINFASDKTTALYYNPKL